MLISPIVHRELLVCLRRIDLRRWRDRRVFGMTAFVIALLVLEAFGIRIFQFTRFWLFVIAAALAAALPMSRCLGLIREEREAQTFPLLRLAGIGPLEFFAGKALSAFWLTAYEVLGLVPLIALPFLAGGLAYRDFLDMLASLPAIVCASIGLTLFASAVCREESAAQVLLFAMVFAWCFGIPLVHGLGRLATGGAPFGSEVLWISPVYAMTLIEGSASPTARMDLWRSIGLMWAVGFGSMATAALWLNLTWKQDEIAASKHVLPRRRLMEPDDPFKALRWNPIEEWVAGESVRLRWPYIGLTLLAGFWGIAAVVWGRAWMGSLMGLLVMLLVALTTASIASLLLAAKVAHERKNGALETLLGTPITQDMVVDGYVFGMRRLVHPFQKIAAGFAMVVWVAGLISRSWNVAALFSYTLIGAVLIAIILNRRLHGLYRTFRTAFVSGRAYASVGRGAGFGFANFFNLLQIYRMMHRLFTSGSLPEFPTGSVIETTLVLVAGFIALAVRAAFDGQESPARAFSILEMRELLQTPPMASTDERWKSWNPDEPFPF